MKTLYHLHVVDVHGVWKTFSYSSWENGHFVLDGVWEEFE